MKVIKLPSPEAIDSPFKQLDCCFNHEALARKRSNSSEDNDEGGPIVKRVKSIIPTPPQIVTDDSSPSDGYQTPSPPQKEESPSENIPEPSGPKIRRSARRATADAVKKIVSFHGNKIPFGENQQTRSLRQRRPRRVSIPETAPMLKQRHLLPVVNKIPKKPLRKRQRNLHTQKRQKSHSMRLIPEMVKTFFEAADRFSLQTFREHADAFKAEFFHAKKSSEVRFFRNSSVKKFHFVGNRGRSRESFLEKCWRFALRSLCFLRGRFKFGKFR